MKAKTAAIALAALISGPMLIPQAAQARHYRHSHHRQVVYTQRCSGGNGAVGTVAGGVGGALIGNAVGGGTLGTVAGGVGGALLGRHLDKSNTRSRHGC
jgi:outer membrane lipoprotein SlyB